MQSTVQAYILLFFTCACLGWLMEVICKAIQFRRFINRGFLIGPYCPIYGFGAVLITALLSWHAQSPWAVFVLAMVIAGTLEYVTSYAMEKLFHARWWDYSHRHFNLNGRVCANTLIPFGVMGLIMIYWFKPLCFGFFERMPSAVRSALCIGLCVLLLADVIVSTRVLLGIRHTANLCDGDNTEHITRIVYEKLATQGRLMRRTLHAFPYARLYSNRLLTGMKQQQQRVKAEARRAAAELRQEIDRREQRLREELKKASGRDRE